MPVSLSATKTPRKHGVSYTVDDQLPPVAELEEDDGLVQRRPEETRRMPAGTTAAAVVKPTVSEIPGAPATMARRAHGCRPWPRPGCGLRPRRYAYERFRFSRSISVSGWPVLLL